MQMCNNCTLKVLQGLRVVEAISLKSGSSNLYRARGVLSRSYSSGSKPSKRTTTSSTTYCVDIVRKHDYEMFLCTLLIPDPEVRTRVMAVRAFNTEIALIRDQVTHKDTGLARLAFWKDSINQLYQAKQSDHEELKYVPRQPTVSELTRVIMERNVSKKWFTNLLDGRERIMSDAPFKDVTELESYSDQTVTSIFYLAFEMLGVKSVDVDHAASHLGKAIGISNFIRSIPHNSQQRRVLVPHNLVIKHGLSQEAFIRNKEKDKVKDLIFDAASQAHNHYEKAKSLKKSIDKRALPLFAAGVPSEIYLKRLQKVNFDPYDPSLNRRYGLLPWHLFYRKLTKSYL